MITLTPASSIFPNLHTVHCHREWLGVQSSTEAMKNEWLNGCNKCAPHAQKTILITQFQHRQCGFLARKRSTPRVTWSCRWLGENERGIERKKIAFVSMKSLSESEISHWNTERVHQSVLRHNSAPKKKKKMSDMGDNHPSRDVTTLLLVKVCWFYRQRCAVWYLYNHKM